MDREEMIERAQLLRTIETDLLFKQSLERLPRWRRPLRILNRSWALWSYEKIEQPWSWFVVSIFFRELLEPRIQARAAYEIAKQWQFKLAEALFFWPVHYGLRPGRLRFPIMRLWRKVMTKTVKVEYTPWVAIPGEDEQNRKLREWERRMLRGGPMPQPHGDHRAAFAAMKRVVETIPPGVFDQTTETRSIEMRPNVWAIELFNSANESQGFVYALDGTGLVLRPTKTEADEAGAEFMSELHRRQQAEADHIRENIEMRGLNVGDGEDWKGPPV